MVRRAWPAGQVTSRVAIRSGPYIIRRSLLRLSTMRSILILAVLLVIACGAVFGALNGAPIPLDFYFFATTVPAGIALLCALLAGWLLGGLVAWLGQLPRRRRERRAALREAARQGTPADGDQRR
jgi:uncharacterized integral membrane protein